MQYLPYYLFSDQQTQTQGEFIKKSNFKGTVSRDGLGQFLNFLGAPMILYRKKCILVVNASSRWLLAAYFCHSC
jgi:hypothetical protein